MEAFKAFLIDRIGSGTIVNPSKEDMVYLTELAGRCKMTLMQLLGVVMKMAGGWGDKENSIRLVGYVKDSPVITKQIGESKSAAGLVIETDDSILFCNEDTYDATRLTIKTADTFGNLMPFTQECVQLQLEGPGKIMGPDRFALTGGVASFWIRTTGKEGIIQVSVQGMSATVGCEITVIKR